MTATGQLKVKVGGVWQNATLQGPPGPQGPQGVMGVSTIIVGSFGTSKTPADLPPDGNIPVDWDRPGVPAHQMVLGESLVYMPVDITDPLYGHLHQFLAPNWADIGQVVGPMGPPGPIGSTGADGVAGPPGPQGGPVPVGGVLGEVIVKTGPADFEVAWQPARPRILLRAQIAVVTITPANVMFGMISGNVTIDPTRWYHIFASARCVSDPGLGARVNFNVQIGTINLRGHDVVASTDPNGLWGAWSQNWIEPGTVFGAGGTLTANLRAQVNINNLIIYDPRLHIIEY